MFEVKHIVRCLLILKGGAIIHHVHMGEASEPLIVQDRDRPGEVLEVRSRCGAPDVTFMEGDQVHDSEER